MDVMPHMSAEEFVNLLLGKKGSSTRNICRTIKQGILIVTYQTRNSDGARLGLVVGTAAGLELGPGAVVTGYIGARIGSIFDSWTTYTKYFEVSTGTFLGTSANEAASKCNKNGLYDFRQRNFNEAKDWFNKAYHTCANGYRDEDQFKKNRKVAKIAAKAECMLNEGNYVLAVSEFQTALNISSDRDLCNVLSDRIDQAKQKQNEAAINFNQRGVEFFQRGDFGAALQNFNEAYNSCTLECVLRKKYINNKSVAEVMIIAQGMFNKGEYAAAIVKFQEAYINAEGLNDNCILYYINLVKNKQNELAANYYCHGLASFREADLTKASQYFEKAYHSCADDWPSKSKYLNAVNTVNITSEAETMSNTKKFDAAVTKFKDAYEFSLDTEMKRFISVYIEKTYVAKATAALKQGKLDWDNAWAAENSNNVKLANTKFQQANCYFSKALNIKDNAEYQSWLNASCLKMEGNKLFNQGIKLFEDSKLQEALNKLGKAQTYFQQGFHASQDEKFSECVSYVQSRIQYIKDKLEEIREIEEINNAMQAVVVGIPVTPSHAELDEKLLLEDQDGIKKNNSSYLSRQFVSVGNGFS